MIGVNTMRILVTGGLGNLGLWLTKSLLDVGHKVSVIGRHESVIIAHPNYEFLNADITCLDSLKAVISIHYDACIHAASYNEHFEDNYSKKSLLVNSLGTDYLCQALTTHGVGKLIYLSTFHVYGNSEGEISEDTSINPNNDYGLTHFFAEKYIEKHGKTSGLQYVIFRLTNSYGCPEDVNTNKWYLVLNDICKQAVDSNVVSLTSNGKSLRDFIWMGDVVKIVMLSLSTSFKSKGIYNLSSSKTFSINEIAEYVKKVYFRMFDKHLEVIVNQNDTFSPTYLKVLNTKLLSHFNYSFENMFVEEIERIITMLRASND